MKRGILDGRSLTVKRHLLLICLLACVALLGFLIAKQQQGAPSTEFEVKAVADAAPLPAQPDPGLGASDPEDSRAPIPDGASVESLAPRIAFEDGFDLRGRTVDDLGQPNTRFRIKASLTGRSGGKRATRHGIRHSPDGTFRISNLTAGQWEITARDHGDLRSAPVLVTIPDTMDGVTLVLPRGARVSGTVVNAGGLPLAEASVYFRYAGEDERIADQQPRARTDPEGRFRTENIQPGKVLIMASHPDASDSVWSQLEVAPGQTLEGVRIELCTGGRIEGLVDPSLGEVADRKVNLVSFRGSIGERETKTDATGRFVIERVIPQDYVIELSRTIEESGSRIGTSGIRKRISVSDGQTTEVVFGGNRRLVLVHGMIHARGEPLSDLRVQAYSKSGHEDRGEVVTTGFDGRYEITLAGPGDYAFSVSADRGSYVEFERTVPDQDQVELSFELSCGLLSGRVVGHEGRPLRRVPISCVRSGWSDKRSFYRDHYRRMYTGDDGTFEFRLLAPGTYTLRAPDGFQDDSPPPRVPYGRIVVPDLVIDGDAQVSGLELRLPAEGRISGMVVDGKGLSVTNAWIRVKDARDISLSARWETRTDATGHFEIENVARGTYTVAVWTAELETTSPPVDVEEGKTASTRIELR